MYNFTSFKNELIILFVIFILAGCSAESKNTSTSNTTLNEQNKSQSGLRSTFSTSFPLLKTHLLVLIIAATWLLPACLIAQDTWTQKADFGGIAR